MAYTHTQAVILAAGKSSRFGTHQSKLTYSLCGKPMIMYPLDLFHKLGIKTTLIVGHQQDMIKQMIRSHGHTDVSFCTQKEQKGTGHAVACSRHTWDKEHILITNGDMPFINEHIIQKLIDTHNESDATISFVASYCKDTDNGYGRVIQSDNHIAIIEARDIKDDITQYDEINAGIYLIKKQFLKDSIDALIQSSITGELYITDLISIASDSEKTVNVMYADFEDIQGVNTLQELSRARFVKQHNIHHKLMNKGVHIIDPDNTYIDITARIKAGTIIEPSAHIKGSTSIGSNCTIKTGSVITNTDIDDDVTIEPYCVITDTHIKDKATVGPFARIRNDSIIKHGATIGNFVEISKSNIGAQSKAKHLTYIGNADIKNNVNIGAGTVFCNYNGVSKHKTTVFEHTFIGSNTTLVAPLEIGAHSIVGAGSTITESIEDNDLAIARSRQVNKQGYASKLKEKYQQSKKS
jgi:bifunctional UDP-N-acetylglucosamine pyrophosphorylase/glucosamine-1-phosphate N-acetyltransferase